MRVLLVLLGTIIITASCSDEAPPPPIVIQPAKVMTVGTQNQLTRELPGTVRASQRSELSFQVPGRIVEFDVNEGQEVAKGALLARLDESDYKSNVDAAAAERNKNKANFDRAKDLIKDNFISQSDYDKLEAAYDVSVANLERAEKALADSRLIAPFAGVIARTFVQNFEDITAKQPILSLQDTSELEIVLAISETLAARRDKTAKIEILARFDAIPDETFELVVKEFAAEADPKTQTYEVVAAMVDRNVTNVLPGMTATVKVTRTSAGKDTGALTLPLIAIFASEGDSAAVWIVEKDNTVRRQPVATGELVGTEQIEVTSGLEAGDVIVVAGVSSLTEGMEISPVTEVGF